MCFVSNVSVIFCVHVQGGETMSNSAEHQILPCDKHFQTDALQVAVLTQVGRTERGCFGKGRKGVFGERLKGCVGFCRVDCF